MKRQLNGYQYQFSKRIVYVVMGHWRSLSGMWFGSRAISSLTLTNHVQHLVCKTKAHARRQHKRLPLWKRKLSKSFKRYRLKGGINAWAWAVSRL